MVSKPRLTLAPIIPGNDTKFGIDPPLLLEKSNGDYLFLHVLRLLY